MGMRERRHPFQLGRIFEEPENQIQPSLDSAGGWEKGSGHRCSTLGDVPFWNQQMLADFESFHFKVLLVSEGGGGSLGYVVRCSADKS